MTLEEKMAIARRIRGGTGKKKVITPEELNAVPHVQKELAIPFGDSMVRVYQITPAAGLPENAPLVLHIHGGGFISGRMDRDQLFCAELAADLNCMIWDIDHTLAPECTFPQPVEECTAVARYAVDHAGELGVDPARIALLGHSSGGNLTTGICLKNAEQPFFHPLCLILDYAPMDLATDPAEKNWLPEDMPPDMARTFNAFYVDPREAVSPLASPRFAEDAQLVTFPETLILSARMDSLSFEEEEFGLRLARLGVPVTLRRFQNSHHGFTINRVDDWEACSAMIHAYLKARF